MKIGRNKKILVLKGDGLTQFVEAEPAFAAIRAAHPEASIDLLTSHELGRLAKGAPFFDRVLAAGPFPDKQSRKNFYSQLRRIGYAKAYDLNGTPESLEIKKALTGFRGVPWVGPNRVVSKDKGHVFVPSFAGPAMRKLLSDAGLEVPQRLPDLGWALEGRKDAANMRPSWYGITGDFALLIPAMNDLWRWPAEYYAEVASALVERGVTPVLIGSSDMKAFGHEVSQLMVQIGPRGGARALVDLTDKTDLAQLAALAKDAKFFVSGITEELQLAVSVGCPGVVIVHPEAEQEAEGLFGRQIVRFTAEDMATLAPETVVSMLSSMGLLAVDKKQQSA
jgi:lipopolysaccharide heptosyltransferase II